jgi:predicted aminopeptidase
MLVLLLVALGGCATLGYYAQSIGGQMEVWDKQQPITELLDAPDTSESLREKLQTVLAIRDFATAELALPDNDSYRSYADLERPFVVWNVFAAQPFEMSLKRWCFPFAGCVGYRGYFSKADAQNFAKQIASEGLETYVAGVAAYSTLGWFDDPLLNTVMPRSPAHIAGLIFHELAHQQLYVEGDTAFNEGFASTVELEGVRRWLAMHGSEEERLAYTRFRQRQNDFVSLVTRTRDELQALYEQALSVTEMQARKTAIQAQLRLQYQQLKKQWGVSVDNNAGYDAWFAQDLNNAQLAAVTTYGDHVPAFQRLLAEQGGDMAAFYRACARLGELPREKRSVVLAGLAF